MTINHATLLLRQFEPEGIFLLAPLEGPCVLLQGWGDSPEHHAHYTYHGVALKGHPGIDFAAEPGTTVRATDDGRVVEINAEPDGFGVYLKLEHSWGESLYAQLGTILVEAGQLVQQGTAIATIGRPKGPFVAHLHFAIRILPYNRFDGWGGFSDPLAFLYQLTLIPSDENGWPANGFLPPPLLLETKGRRRP